MISIIQRFWCKPVGIHKTFSPARFLVYRRPSVAVKLAWCSMLLSTFAHTGSESYPIRIASKIVLSPSMRGCRSSVCPSESLTVGSRCFFRFPLHRRCFLVGCQICSVLLSRFDALEHRSFWSKCNKFVCPFGGAPGALWTTQVRLLSHNA